MKKTISLAALAISASSSFAFIGWDPGRVTKNYCLDMYQGAEGVNEVGDCDQSQNNVLRGLEVNSLGCTSDQTALTTSKGSDQAEFDIQIHLCLPPNVAQL